MPSRTFSPRSYLNRTQTAHMRQSFAVIQPSVVLGTLPPDNLGLNQWGDDFMILNPYSTAASLTPGLYSRAGINTIRLNLAAIYRWKGDSPNLHKNLPPPSGGPQYAYIAGNYGPTTTGLTITPNYSPINLINNLILQMNPVPRITLLCNFGSNAAGTDANTIQDTVDFVNYVNFGVISADMVGKLPARPASWNACPIVAVEADNEMYAPSAVDAYNRFPSIRPTSFPNGKPVIGPYGLNMSTSPQSAHAYGLKVAQLADAIHAIDPNAGTANRIRIVASLYLEDSTLPACPYTAECDASYGDGTGLGWNQSVLAACGSKIDEVQVHDFPYFGTTGADAAILQTPTRIAAKVATIRGYITTYCAANPLGASGVLLAMTAGNSCGQAHPLAHTVTETSAGHYFDTRMTWLRQGTARFHWFTGHTTVDTALLDPYGVGFYHPRGFGNFGAWAVGNTVGGVSDLPANSPFPTALAMELSSHMGASGDSMVLATGSDNLIAAHATKLSSGPLAVGLVNRDSGIQQTKVIVPAGFTPRDGTGTLYYYSSRTGGIATTALSGISFPYTVSLDPYAVAVLVVN